MTELSTVSLTLSLSSQYYDRPLNATSVMTGMSAVAFQLQRSFPLVFSRSFIRVSTSLARDSASDWRLSNKISIPVPVTASCGQPRNCAETPVRSMTQRLYHDSSSYVSLVRSLRSLASQGTEDDDTVVDDSRSPVRLASIPDDQILVGALKALARTVGGRRAGEKLLRDRRLDRKKQKKRQMEEEEEHAPGRKLDSPNPRRQLDETGDSHPVDDVGVQLGTAPESASVLVNTAESSISQSATWSYPSPANDEADHFLELRFDDNDDDDVDSHDSILGIEERSFQSDDEVETCNDSAVHDRTSLLSIKNNSSPALALRPWVLIDEDIWFEEEENACSSGN